MTEWTKYGICMQHKNFSIWGGMFYIDKFDTNGGSKRYDLHTLFSNHVNPTTDERALFKMEFGIDYPELEMLLSFFGTS